MCLKWIDYPSPICQKQRQPKEDQADPDFRFFATAEVESGCDKHHHPCKGGGNGQESLCEGKHERQRDKQGA